MGSVWRHIQARHGSSRGHKEEVGREVVFGWMEVRRGGQQAKPVFALTSLFTQKGTVDEPRTKRFVYSPCICGLNAWSAFLHKRGLLNPFFGNTSTQQGQSSVARFWARGGRHPVTVESCNEPAVRVVEPLLVPSKRGGAALCLAIRRFIQFHFSSL